MTIKKSVNNDEVIIEVEGRVDTNTAKEFETAVKEIPAGTKKLTIDMTGLAYISSAGLRVLLIANQLMDEDGEVCALNPNNEIREILSITGFDDFLNIVEK